MKLRRRAAGLLAACALAASAFAAPDPPVPPSPLDAIRAAIEKQDQLVARRNFEALVAEARKGLKDATPETLYLLGRALGYAAIGQRAAGDAAGSDKLLDESQRCFEEAKESGVVVFAPAYLGLGRCARYRGESELAESERAHSRGDAAAVDVHRRAAKGHLESAVAYLGQALKLAPAFKEAALDLAQILAETGRPTDAESILYRQLELRPKDAELHVVLGMVKLARERVGEAEREFRIVIQSDPNHATARKLLAGALMQEQEFAEAAEHLETYCRLEPKDDEGWRALFYARVQLKDAEGAHRALDSLRRELPGSEAAIWAEDAGVSYRREPEKFEEPPARTPEVLARRLDSNDPKVQRRTLEAMKAVRWDALPAAVYKLLAPSAAAADVRRAAVELIGEQRDARTVTILEILLFHPKEQDPDIDVRRAAARGLAGLPTPAILPVLYKALDAGDSEIREAAVRGISSITGKDFRATPGTATTDADWPAERASYDRWWRTQASASIARRDAADAMAKIFDPIRQGRVRLAEYALPAVDDADARTWRAGYDLFRALTGQDFGAATGEASAEERARIARACREWFTTNGSPE